MRHPKFTSTAIGIAGAVGLLSFYILTMMILAGSWGAVWWQFRELWFLMLPLIAGFGVQIGLFSYIKFISHSANNRMMAALIRHFHCRNDRLLRPPRSRRCSDSGIIRSVFMVG